MVFSLAGEPHSRSVYFFQLRERERERERERGGGGGGRERKRGLFIRKVAIFKHIKVTATRPTASTQ